MIDVEFPSADRGCWCERCDEPFPEGTALCPRCGGPLESATQHRARMAAASRRAMTRLLAGAGAVVLALVALALWLLIR